jgi:hypothetical protein
MPEVTRGPHSYEYLKSFKNGSQLEGGFELPLFSDAYFTGWMAEVGPYEVINTGALEHRPGYFRPCLVLRCAAISNEYRASLEKTDTSRYHGGGLGDELAALLSLILGVRLQAGAVNREFDSFVSTGRPVNLELKPWPESRPLGSFLQVRSVVQSTLISNEALALLNRYDKLSVEAANALVKAARTYQRALWIVEWDPAQAWLLLVSTVEALVDQATPSAQSVEDLLSEYHGELADVIRRRGGPELLHELAPLLEPLLGSLRKFKGFIERFFPDPPNPRTRGPRLTWNIQTIGPMLSTIYAHRSRALHDGTPFPMPVCRPPMFSEEIVAPIEMPIALAESSLGGVWRADDTPMHIYVFEHLVRQSILKWWSACAVNT